LKGKTLIVRAGLIRNIKVITKDQKVLGTLVNIVFSTNPKLLGRAKMLIFPDLASSLKEEFSEAIIDIAGQSITDNLPVESVKKTIEHTTDKVSELVQKGFSKDEAEKLAKFYLVPVTKVVEIKERQKIALNENFQDIASNFCFTDKQSISQEEKAFYCGGAPKDGRLWSCSLNLTQMQNLPVEDSNGEGGEIEDIELDTTYGVVKNLLVSTTGEYAATRLVKLKDFDFARMANTKTFQECDSIN
jgi:sporulation protein YlmC with PRC-barrel domain